MVSCLNPYQLSRCHDNHFFESRFDNFHKIFLKYIFISNFSIQVLNLRKLDTFSMFLMNFFLILSNFFNFPKNPRWLS